MSIPNKPRAVVTGAGSGLGRAFCQVLHSRGASIVASDINLEAVKETAARTGAHPVACDVSKIEDVQRLGEEAERLLGGVDLIVNNAGVAVAGRMGETALSDWQWILGINLWGVIHGCHVFVPKLRRQKSGHVINVASAAGLLAPPLMGPYNVTKAAVVALSETLCGELREDGVGVTVLCPTFFPTNIHKNSRGVTDPGLHKMMEKMVTQGKPSAEEVAAIALDGANADELYVIPQADGRWMWRVKRAMPTRFHQLGPKAIELQMKRWGISLPK
jgi:NAD(P)-dependent dehydrogenase (short-subunit alcohol dehydrogenase family)